MLFSILAADSIAVPLSPAFPVAELKYILNHSEASTLLATERYTDKARALVEDGLDSGLVVDIRPKIAQGSSHSKSITLNKSQSPRGGLMLYTSGTTNRPVSTGVFCFFLALISIERCTPPALGIGSTSPVLD